MDRKEAEQIFWTNFNEDFFDERAGGVARGTNAEIYVIPKLLEAKDLKDVHDTPLGIERPTLRFWTFFVDIEPNANWAHPCMYYLIFENKETESLKHEWPPSENLPLIKLELPY